MVDDPRDPETYAIIGAAMAVHSELGHGFAEPVYQDAFEVELRHRDIPYVREKRVTVRYRDVVLQSYYEPDFICFDSVIVELKALSALTSVHEAQVLNYLKATGLERSLLINLGAAKLEFKRLIWTHESRRDNAI